MKYFILITLILLTLSCSLKRTNPLDPLVSKEGYPGEVHNIDVSIPVSNSVTITWTPVPDADGYYIYRSQGYDDLYELIGVVDDNCEYEDSFDFNPQSNFWYKVSAYIVVDDEKLEGFRSDPKTWNL